MPSNGRRLKAALQRFGLLILIAVLYAAFYLIDPKNARLIFIHQVVMTVVSAPLMPIFWAMIADTASFGLWSTANAPPAGCSRPAPSRTAWASSNAMSQVPKDPSRQKPSWAHLPIKLLPGLHCLITGHTELLE